MAEAIAFKSVEVYNPDELNFIFGMSHFIKTVEDLYEIMIHSVKEFGIAFCEASGERLIRKDGTNNDLIDLAVRNAKEVGCGHTFFIFMKDAFPIQVLTNIKTQCREVVNIYCATANKVQVVFSEIGEQRGVVSVCDGFTPKGVENDEDIKKRKDFLRTIGYKR